MQSYKPTVEPTKPVVKKSAKELLKNITPMKDDNLAFNKAVNEFDDTDVDAVTDVDEVESKISKSTKPQIKDKDIASQITDVQLKEYIKLKKDGIPYPSFIKRSDKYVNATTIDEKQFVPKIKSFYRVPVIIAYTNDEIIYKEINERNLNQKELGELQKLIGSDFNLSNFRIQKDKTSYRLVDQRINDIPVFSAPTLKQLFQKINEAMQEDSRKATFKSNEIFDKKVFESFNLQIANLGFIRESFESKLDTANMPAFVNLLKKRKQKNYCI